jgi:glycine oxidase
MASRRSASDVLVIGGGVIGLSIAWRCARRGLSVTLLERGRVGEQASWAAPGVLAAAAWHRRDATVAFQRESLRRYPDFCRELESDTGFDVEYTRCGTLDLLFEEQQFRMAMAEVDAASGFRDEAGLPLLRLLTPAQAGQLEPKVTRHLLGAKYCTFNAQVRNSRLLHALDAAVRAAGAHVVEGADVVALIRDGHRVTGARTADTSFHAATTVLAAGAWSTRIDERVGRHLPVYPVRGQVVAIDAQPGTITRIVKHRKCYLVPRRDGRILIGSTVEHQSGFDTDPTAQGVNDLLAGARRLVPPIEHARFIRAWAGLRPTTSDRRPYIGPVPGTDGLLVATGHHRTGVGLAPLTAEAIADLATAGRTNVDLRPFDPTRTPDRGSPGLGDDADA